MAQKKYENISFANYLVNTKQELHQTLDKVVEKVDWTAFETLLKPVHNKNFGRKSYPAVLMFRCLLLQNWYNLSDYELEKAIDDRLSFRRFVGLDYTQNVPDHSSFCRFRDELVKQHLDTRLFNELSRQIEKMGLVIKKGTLVDASILEADVGKPKPKNDGSGGSSRHDSDASWTKKNGKSYFGYKMHVGVDQESGIIRRQAFTPAHVHDSNLFKELVSKDEECVYADKGYPSEEHHRFLKEHKIKNGILFKNEKRDSIFVKLNAYISGIRSRVETVFGVLKRHYGYRRVRYRRLAKNALQFSFLSHFPAISK